MASNFLLSYFAAPLIERLTDTRFWTIYRGLEKGDASGAFAGRAASALPELLRVAEQVPYWKATFESVGIVPSEQSDHALLKTFSLIPVSTKQTYIRGFPDQVTVPGKRDNWQYLSSAGTTDRMTVVTDFSKRDYLRAAEHFNLYKAIGRPFGLPTVDIPPSACNVVCGLADAGPEPILPYLLWALRKGDCFNRATMADIRGRFERQVLFNRTTLEPIEAAPWEQMAEQLDQYLDLIQSRRIAVIRAYPHFLFWLAKRAAQRSLSFSAVKALIPYGGLCSESMVEEIERVFSARFVNVYGTGEVGAIGVDNQQGLTEINRSLVHVEVLDEQGNTVADGEVGDIVVTDLCNRAMPIIRYKIGDVARCIESSDGAVKRLKVLGRKAECFAGGDGRNVHARDMQNLFFSFPEVINYKIEKLGQKLVKILVVNLAPCDETALLEQVTQLLGLKARPVLKKVPFIPPANSGKYVAFKAGPSLASAVAI